MVSAGHLVLRAVLSLGFLLPVLRARLDEPLFWAALLGGVVAGWTAPWYGRGRAVWVLPAALVGPLVVALLAEPLRPVAAGTLGFVWGQFVRTTVYEPFAARRRVL